MRRNFPELGVLLSLLAVCFGFTVASREFLSFETWGNILTVTAEIGLIAAGVTLLMIAREFDLSVGSNFALSAMLVATLLIKGVPAWIAVVAGIAVGSAVGAVNGWVTVWTGIPSFITTLGAVMFWRGVVLAFTGGWPITLDEKPGFFRILAGPIGTTEFAMSALWWIAACAGATFLLQHTRFGNWTFATGGKPGAAWARGIPTGKVRILCFALAGACAALAGIMQFARLGSMSPTDGVGLELEAIAATVIGGTSLMGGRGTVLGTALGALLMGVLSTGLVLAGAPTYWFRSFIGLIIVVAVVFNTRFNTARLGRSHG
jgi:simple sugar transport system permease protein